MVRSVSASAPGKVIIVGEHFVVEGARALVTSIERRVRVTVRRAEGGLVEIESNMLGKLRAGLDPIRRGVVEVIPHEARPFAAVLRRLHIEGFDLIPHKVVVESSLPPSAGLGSSAASMVAYTLAYTAFLGDPVSGERLFDIAMEGEREAHGRPSGVDIAIAVWGGMVSYSRHDGVRRLDTRLDGVSLAIADTGRKRRTRDVVEHVLRVKNSLGRAGDLIYEAADLISGQAIVAVEKGDAEMLGFYMNVSQGLLEAVGASSAEISRIVYAMRSGGALGAKLTGAGWGGCVIGLAWSRDSAKVSEAAMLGGAVSSFEATFPGGGAEIDYP